MSSERGRRRELKRAGIAAAREARAVLAEAIAALDGELASTRRSRGVAESIARAVGSLFRTELGEPEDVRDRLRESAAALGRVLEDLHAPDAASLLDEAGPLVARSLAILHPARAELDRELARQSDAEPRPAMIAAPRGSGSERRSSPRVRIEAEVGGHSGSHFFSGRAGDVSSGGLFVATSDPLAIGTELTLGLVLADGDHVVVDGIVSWVRGPHAGLEGMGIRFAELAPDVRDAIARQLA
ncbi:MAG: PilZ domain-containing protein [Myxococcota bacterium]|nr:PilZ domain-containing protein [Myxococcota bacterium]